MKEEEKRERQEPVSRGASRRDVFIVPRFEAVRHFRWARLAAISRESIVEFVLQSRRLVYRRYTSCTVPEIEDLVPPGSVRGFVRSAKGNASNGRSLFRVS